jgi:predicted lipid-binding transport protein (Tim44 family)
MNELVKALVSQLGVTDEQASKGAGLLFKAAKERLGEDFPKIEKALPDVARLVQGAPSASSTAGGGLGGMLGGLASALGGGSKIGTLASLAGAFSSLKLAPDMIGRFIPVILETVKSKAGPDIFKLLAGALK